MRLDKILAIFHSTILCILSPSIRGEAVTNYTLTLKADRPHLHYYHYTPPDYRHTDIYLTSDKLTNRKTDKQKDGRTLPSALSPCFAKATRSIINVLIEMIIWSWVFITVKTDILCTRCPAYGNCSGPVVQHILKELNISLNIWEVV